MRYNAIVDQVPAVDERCRFLYPVDSEYRMLCKDQSNNESIES